MSCIFCHPTTRIMVPLQQCIMFLICFLFFLFSSMFTSFLVSCLYIVPCLDKSDKAFSIKLLFDILIIVAIITFVIRFSNLTPTILLRLEFFMSASASEFTSLFSPLEPVLHFLLIKSASVWIFWDMLLNNTHSNMVSLRCTGFFTVSSITSLFFHLILLR